MPIRVLGPRADTAPHQTHREIADPCRSTFSVREPAARRTSRTENVFPTSRTENVFPTSPSNFPLSAVRLLDHDRWAIDHHGLVARRALGISSDRWRSAVRAGLIQPLHSGLARMPGSARTREQAILTAVLAAGDGALASHRSAAYLWGCERPEDDPVDVIVAGRRRHPRLPDCVAVGERHVPVLVHRPSDGGRLTPQRRAGIACTNILRTLLDLGAVDSESVEAAVIESVAQRRTGLGALATAVTEHGRQGRAGIRALRDAIVEVSLDQKPVDSELEPTMAPLAGRYMLPVMEFHPIIAGWEVDFWVVDTPLILECDGWSSHGLDREQFETDRRKDDDLRAAGWVVMRFSYRSIVRDAADTARRFRRAVDRWEHLPVPPR
jgi:hypothetical protein